VICIAVETVGFSESSSVLVEWSLNRLVKFCWTRNTFCGTRYMSHCCALFCSKTFFL